VVFFDEYASRYPYAQDGRVPTGPDTGLLEPWSTLAFLAANTRTVRLGTGICIVPQRNPVYLAKEIATVDWLSNGRVDVGIGVGWLREEFEAAGVPWPARGKRTDEYLEVMHTLWQDDVSSHSGEFYTLKPCRQYPKPVQDPQPPIYVGGESEAALARVARSGQGWLTFNRTPAELADPLARLTDLLAERGRTRSDVSVAVCPYLQALDVDAVEGYAEAGADRLAVIFLAGSAEQVPAAFDALTPIIERAKSC
jgi:probable F420-dependent oxidoreductase